MIRLRHFILKAIILPRQARDEHRESTPKQTRFLAITSSCNEFVLRYAICCAFSVPLSQEFRKLAPTLIEEGLVRKVRSKRQQTADTADSRHSAQHCIDIYIYIGYIRNTLVLSCLVLSARFVPYRVLLTALVALVGVPRTAGCGTCGGPGGGVRGDRSGQLWVY